MFHHLQQLVITPLQLSDDVVLMLAERESLEEIVIVQDQYTPESETVNHHVWWDVKQTAPHLKVRLESRGRAREELLLQENAPVWCILYRSPYLLVDTAAVVQAADMYRASLRAYGHVGLPRRHGSASFHDRADSSLVLLVRECKALRTLFIRHRVSTATLLLLASEGKSLRELYVRRQAVLLRADWPRSPEWSAEWYAWLRQTARSYSRTEDEVGRLLHCDWSMLSDKEFKKACDQWDAEGQLAGY